MSLKQSELDQIQRRLELGEITADEANVEKVKMVRVQLITTRLPAQVRKVLNKAVRNGELGHIKKEGKKPEAYFHPKFEYLVAGERNKAEREVLNALAQSKAFTA